MELDNFITPPLFYDLLCSSERVLVFDVRKKADFLCDRIWSSIHLDLETFPSISAIAKHLYLTPKHQLNDNNCPITPYTHHKLFTNWELYRIVVVDENGSAHALVQQFKHNTNKHLSTQLLVGGYKTFKALYSDLCQGSSGEDKFLIDKCLKKWNENYPLEILPHLFCGDTEVATNYRALDVLGIECMVNVAAFVDNHAPYAYTYLRCDQEEIPSGDLEDLFNRVFRFIEIAKKGYKKVLIYSATDKDGLAGMFACAYLMHFNNWSLESSFLYFKSKCHSFSPNVAILARLGDYETTLVGTKFIEENMKQSDDGGEEDKIGRSKLSDELKYVRRQQVHKLEEEIAEQAAMEDDEEEEDLC